MILYNIKSEDGEIRITKFDDDLNPESSYIVSDNDCECPQWQGRSKECRHMKMLPMMIERIDTPWFFCFDGPQAGMWFDPTGQAEAEREAPISGSELHSDEPGLDWGFASLPEGVTVVGLADPALLHNTIADAVGEPGAKLRRRF